MSVYGQIVDDRPSEIVNHGGTGINCVVWPNGKVWGQFSADIVKDKPAGVLQLSIRMRGTSHKMLKKFTLGIVYIDETTGVGTVVHATDQVWNICDPVPVHIEGQYLQRERTKGGEFGPEIDVGAGGGRIGSYNRSTSYTDTRAWSFRGRRGYRQYLLGSSASWTWISNKWDHNGDRGTLYGGLAFRYQQPTIKIRSFVEAKKKGFWRTKLEGQHSCTLQTNTSDSDFRDVVAGLGEFIDHINTRPTVQVAPSSVPQPSAVPVNNPAAFSVAMPNTAAISTMSAAPPACSTQAQPLDNQVSPQPGPSSQSAVPTPQATSQQGAHVDAQPSVPPAAAATAPVHNASRTSQVSAMHTVSSASPPKPSLSPVLKRPSRVVTD